MIGTIALVAAATALVAWAVSDSGEAGEPEAREIWLVNGARYAITWYEPTVQSPDDAISFLQSIGFCQVDEFNLLPPGGMFYVAAYWCQQNTLWQVPENVSISAL